MVVLLLVSDVFDIACDEKVTSCNYHIFKLLTRDLYYQYILLANGKKWIELISFFLSQSRSPL